MLPLSAREAFCWMLLTFSKITRRVRAQDEAEIYSEVYIGFRRANSRISVVETRFCPRTWHLYFFLNINVTLQFHFHTSWEKSNESKGKDCQAKNILFGSWAEIWNISAKDKMPRETCINTSKDAGKLHLQSLKLIDSNHTLFLLKLHLLCF